MSFEESSNPDDQQVSNTEIPAFANSMQRTESLRVPAIFMLIFPILFSTLYLAPALINVYSNGINRNNLKDVIIGGIIFIVPFILYAAIRGYLLKNAGTFLHTFYDLPDSVKINEMVNLRVNNPSPMPLPKSATIKVKNGRLEPQENWQIKVGGPAKFKIEPGNAVYLERGNRFSRVVGQGTAFMEIHETIKAVLSISPQSKDISFKAWTKDGIWIKMKAKGIFILGSKTRTQIGESELYPFDPVATRTAVDETFSSGKEGHEWSDFAKGKTISLLGEYISDNYLEAIFIPSADGGHLLSTNTMNDLLGKINDRLQKFGISLSQLNITDVELPKQINAERIKLWETGHQAYKTVTEGEIKAYELRSQKKALAEMVHDLVFTLANGLERLDATKLTDKLLASIYEVINQGMKDPRVYPRYGTDVSPDGIVSPDMDFSLTDEGT